MHRLTASLAAAAATLTLMMTAIGECRAAERLGTDVVPVLEEVHLRVDPDSSNYDGWVRVTLDVAKPTRQITLHAEGQKLARVALTQQGRAIATTSERGDQGLLTLTAERALSHGAATLEIHFANAFDTHAVGLYRMTKDGLGYLFTQFEANDARKAFPCSDQPSFKIPWRITLEVPEREQALSNNPIARTASQSGWKTIEFEETRPLPSYLVALAVGPLEFVDVPGVKFPARIVTTKGQARLAGLAASTVAPLVTALERYFDMPYPYRKLDLLALPEFWYGGMENAGAITFAEGLLLVDSTRASVEQRRRINQVIAHELSHMWFGDLVTMAWWDDLWLNESFADWMGDKVSDQVNPQFKVPLAEMQSVQSIMNRDAHPSTDAIRIRGATGNESMRSVGVAYNKGKAVLAMFEHWMGEDTFRRGINQYLRDHSWKNATHDDLWASFGAVSGKDVPAAMAGYIEQNGLPLVSVEPLPDGTLRLTQTRFLNYGVKADPRLWKIPVALRWSDGKSVHTQSVVLEKPSTIVTLEGGGRAVWVMPNVDGRGYYRWKVPPDMLLALAHQSTTAMSPAERIAFLGNLSALLDAGAVRGDAYLKILAEMSDDPEPLAATAVISGLGKADESFVPDELGDSFAAYVRLVLQPMADRYGLERRAGEEEAVALLRPRLLLSLGDQGRDPKALALADRIAAQVMTDPSKADPALAGNALQLHAIHGDRALFDRYRQGFESAKTPVDRSRYLLALGAFDDAALQQEALRYVLQGPLRPNETFPIPRTIAARSDRGADLVLRWMMDNYDRLKTRLPVEFLAGLPGYAAGCDTTRIETARRFFSDPAHQVQGTMKDLEQVSEQVDDCAGLRGREGGAVAAYLKSLPAASGASRAARKSQ
jgi:alanyl aminopeptidase